MVPDFIPNTKRGARAPRGVMVIDLIGLGGPSGSHLAFQDERIPAGLPDNMLINVESSDAFNGRRPAWIRKRSPLQQKPLLRALPRRRRTPARAHPLPCTPNLTITEMYNVPPSLNASAPCATTACRLTRQPRYRRAHLHVRPHS
jgi:hypothetical protein